MALPVAVQKRWRALLASLKRTLPALSRSALANARRVLELESDRDRNRFTNFPETLSTRIIRMIVAIDLRRGAYRKPQGPVVLVPRTSASQASGKKNPGYALGDEGPSPQSLLRGAKAPVDVSKLPPLVFTQKDLERFRTSRTLISWPTRRRRVGSGYGWRRDPYTKKLRFHSGIDIGAPHGSSVWAAADGYVWRSGWLGSCGLGVLIRHRRGMMTYYCHLSHILAPVGKWVKRGELIGKIGSSGRSTAPHLHFSLVLKGKSVDPRGYLP